MSSADSFVEFHPLDTSFMYNTSEDPTKSAHKALTSPRPKATERAKSREIVTENLRCAPTASRDKNKQRDLSNRDKESESQESKSEEQRAISRRTHTSAHNNVNSTGEAQAFKNDTRETGDTSLQSKMQKDPQNCESEDKPQKTRKSRCDKNPAPKRASSKRQSKQRDPSSPGTYYESPEGSKSKSKETYVAETPRTHKTVPNNAHSTSEAQISQNDRQVAAPAVCAGKFEGKEKIAQNPGARDTDVGQTRADEKSTMRMRSVEDTEKVLRATIDKLKIKTCERSKASSCVNDITDAVIAHLKRTMSWCEYIEILRTGSYYENLKICEPDEFDVMLTIPVERVDLQNVNDNGAFYSVALKRNPKKHPLSKFLNKDKTIQASEMLSEFRDAVKDAVETLSYKIVVERKKARCPAVTLQVTENGKTISIDFVLGLKVHCSSWPPFTKNGFKVENWLGTKEKVDLKRQPFYLVPKYEGKGNAEHDGVMAKDSWRISFSHVEKDILKRHGHSKTCCEARGQKCCRKECLKLLKYLLRQLKDMHQKEMSNFCSYHAKTILLHACAKRVEDSEWASNQLVDCFHQLLEDFIKHLRKQELPNFFIPSHNLINPAFLNKSSCDFLAQQIEIQSNNNFPIFC
ncbi:cyclic GMP-AMP synthase-like [Xyrauchen texanus]|uniref:cyclic GMP-AMP synthase-like n=1 Tax=Xyrauchen texanus TaxID=154827 RepID=UPI002242A1F6|nr:cyclic GMP-AMP synthase-like [Xyrauchen texanus]